MSQFTQQRTRWASNGAYQIRQNIFFFIYIVNVFLFNCLLLLGLILSFLQPKFLSTIVNCLFYKIVAELLLVLRGGSFFDRKDLLKYFPIWTLLQIPYVVTVGLLGTFGKFNWKDRSGGADLFNNEME